MSGSSSRQRAHTLFERLLELDAERREAVLDRECSDAPELRALVEALLAADEGSHRLRDADPYLLEQLRGRTVVPGQLPQLQLRTRNRPSARGTLGYPVMDDDPWEDTTCHLSFTVPHTDGSLVFSLRGTEDGVDEWFGIDNVHVTSTNGG